MDWQEIALIVLLVLLAISGGFIKKLWSSLTKFVNVVNDALLDGNISPDEWKEITKEGLNVWQTITYLAQLVAVKKGK